MKNNNSMQKFASKKFQNFQKKFGERNSEITQISCYIQKLQTLFCN